jgi:PAS domain S-box-containing protein/putative nucleotidyltransferase with HDIG domain
VDSLSRHSPLPASLARIGSPRRALLLAAGMFVMVFVLRMADPRADDGETLLYVLPVGLLALVFGVRGGLVGAALSLGLTAVWDVAAGAVALGPVGYVNRALAFFAVALFVGLFVGQRRRVDAELERHFDQSLDLLWSADLAGRLVRVNPAWRRALGHPPDKLTGRCLTELVDPRDRDGVGAEILALAGGSKDTIATRSRFLTSDGGCVWLEWSARATPGAGVIDGVAHDVTLQRKAEQQLAGQARRLETMVAERTRDLEESRAETLQLLAVAGEYRDDETSQHTERVGALAAEIGARLGLSEESVTLLREAAPLHDIGKLAIPDRVLLKPGRLSPEERVVMHNHTSLGARLLFGSRSPTLQLAGMIAESHHEWWDGSGYPAGLLGADIPLVGRIVAVADVYDALTHDRPYKAAWPVEQALAMIRSGAGRQFDPAVVNAFLEIIGQPGGTVSRLPSERLRDSAGEQPSLPAHTAPASVGDGGGARRAEQARRVAGGATVAPSAG